MSTQNVKWDFFLWFSNTVDSKTVRKLEFLKFFWRIAFPCSLRFFLFFLLCCFLIEVLPSHFYFCIPLGLRAHLWKVLSLLPVFPMSKKGCQLGAKCRFHKNWQWQTTLLRKWPSLISLKIHSSFTHYPKCPYFVGKSVKMENVTFLVRLWVQIWILPKNAHIDIWIFSIIHSQLFPKNAHILIWTHNFFAKKCSH